MSFAAIDDIILDHRVKGIPGGAQPFRLGDHGLDIGPEHLNVQHCLRANHASDIEEQFA